MSSPSDAAALDAAALDPAPLLRLGNAFVASRTFLSAVELDLFTHLETPLTARQIQAALHLHDRAIPDFPDALAALGALTRVGAGPDATYANTPDAAAYLARSSPSYLGAFLVMNATRVYHFWEHFTEALQTGCPQNEAHPRNKGDCAVWDAMYSSPEKLATFIAAMSALNTPAHAAFAETFQFNRADHILDVGGALAQLSCEVATRHPHVKCRSLDFPNVCVLAAKNVAARACADRVILVEGDMWADQFPPSDVIVMSHILHDYDLAKKKMLMKKAYDALREGGRFVAIEMHIDDERRDRVVGLLMSLTMLMETDGGFDYTANDFEGWAKEVGFTRCRRFHLHGPTHAVVAYKYPLGVS